MKKSGSEQQPFLKGRRRPRAAFERSIRRIIHNIERFSIHEVRWNYFELHENRHARVKVNSVWAVGSFARGAATCGDLDLIMGIEIVEGHEPRPRTLASQIAGRHPDVVIYIGDPEKNSARVAFPEAILLWSQESREYEAVLEKIKINDVASRFPRRYDLLPLRREQFHFDGELDELVELGERKIITWDWIPAETINPECGSHATDHFLKMLALSRGAKTLETLRLAVLWFSSQAPAWSWSYHGGDSRLRMGTYEILTGPQPTLYLNRLRCIECSHLALSPHITRRGPNGIWIISRGREHPLERIFRNKEAFVEVSGGEPVFSNKHSHNIWWQSKGVQLFKAPRANRLMDSFSGTKLLSLLSLVEWVSFDRKIFRLNRWNFDPAHEMSVITALPDKKDEDGKKKRT